MRSAWRHMRAVHRAALACCSPLTLVALGRTALARVQVFDTGVRANVVGRPPAGVAPVGSQIAPELPGVFLRNVLQAFALSLRFCVSNAVTPEVDEIETVHVPAPAPDRVLNAIVFPCNPVLFVLQEAVYSIFIFVDHFAHMRPEPPACPAVAAPLALRLPLSHVDGMQSAARRRVCSLAGPACLC